MGDSAGAPALVASGEEPFLDAAWTEAIEATELLRTVLGDLGLADAFPRLRGDVNVYGRPMVTVGRIEPAAARRLAAALSRAVPGRSGPGRGRGASADGGRPGPEAGLPAGVPGTEAGTGVPVIAAPPRTTTVVAPGGYPEHAARFDPPIEPDGWGRHDPRAGAEQTRADDYLFAPEPPGGDPLAGVSHVIRARPVAEVLPAAAMPNPRPYTGPGSTNAASAADDLQASALRLMRLYGSPAATVPAVQSLPSVPSTQAAQSAPVAAVQQAAVQQLPVQQRPVQPHPAASRSDAPLAAVTRMPPRGEVAESGGGHRLPA